MVSLEPLAGASSIPGVSAPGPAERYRVRGARSRPSGLRRADRRGPRDHEPLSGRDHEVEHDPGGGPEEDRGPRHVEPQSARTLDDDPAEDERRPTEVLADDRPDQAQRRAELEGRE